jgi:hypothetical protein
MTISTLCRWIVLLAVLPGFVVFAQENPQKLEFHSCTGQIGGGFARALGSDSTDLQNYGGVFEAGGGFAINRRFAFNLNFMFYASGVPTSVLQQQQGSPQNGSARFYSTFLEPTYIIYPSRKFNFYGLGGFGWLRRSVKFSNPGNSLVHPGGVALPGGGSSDAGAFDGGGGVNVRVNHAGLRAYVEARYVHGLARLFDTSLVPITAGFRW